MGTYDSVQYGDVTENELIKWAKAQGVNWAQSRQNPSRWNATMKTKTGVRLIGVGDTLKKCLWVAFKMIIDGETVST